MSEIGKIKPNQLNPLNQGPLSDKRPQVTDDKLREVADMYEQHFIRAMMKEMRSTVHEGGMITQNNAEKMFREQLDENYAQEWGKAGGIGLADLIHNQLMERYGEQLGLKQKVEKPHGPLQLDHKSEFTATRLPSIAESSNSTQIKFEPKDKENLSVKTVSVKSPWAGTLLDKKNLEMDQMQYRIKHDNGLESLIMTRGTGLAGDAKLSSGDRIEAGQQLGWAEATSPLFWTVKKVVSE